MYQMLSKAILIATTAHKDQYDKQGKPYILHPLHLMNQFTWDIELAIIAVLHDVIEDSKITIEFLNKEGFSNRILIALKLLTHIKNISYEDYILRISTNYDCILIKIKDLEHNLNITRLKGISQKDIERIQKYHVAFTLLGKAKKEFQKQKD